MAKRDFRPKPLYRRVNTRTHGVCHGNGGDFRWQRNTKAEKRSEATRGTMHKEHRHGLDYTPLYRFLLSRVGSPWEDVYEEAVSRLDREEPIFRMVAQSEDEQEAIVRLDENTYFSGLYVDEDGKLKKVDATLDVDRLDPFCSCCTHTFNGERFVRPFRDRIGWTSDNPWTPICHENAEECP